MKTDVFKNDIKFKKKIKIILSILYENIKFVFNFNKLIKNISYIIDFLKFIFNFKNKKLKLF